MVWPLWWALTLVVSRTGQSQSPATPPKSTSAPKPGATSPATSPATTSVVATALLDRWIVNRYREAGLLPDTANAAPSLASTRTPPRIESVSEGATSDSLWAVHFSVDDQAPAFAVGATVRLTGPTGAVTTLSGKVIARRPFRAPRVPGASPTKDSNWREGWAYLVLLPHDATRHVARYRGWLLLTAPRTVPRTVPRSEARTVPRTAQRAMPTVALTSTSRP